jgi:hypothetical protein
VVDVETLATLARDILLEDVDFTLGTDVARDGSVSSPYVFRLLRHVNISVPVHRGGSLSSFLWCRIAWDRYWSHSTLADTQHEDNSFEPLGIDHDHVDYNGGVGSVEYDPEEDYRTTIMNAFKDGSGVKESEQQQLIHADVPMFVDMVEDIEDSRGGVAPNKVDPCVYVPFFTLNFLSPFVSHYNAATLTT